MKNFRSFRLLQFLTIFFICMLVSLANCPPSFAYPDQQNEVIQHRVTPNGLTETWFITQPNVKQAETAYTQIVFRRGDKIVIDSDGCVQTGGHGRTWKRYVNPSGSNSNRYYFGLIRINGVTNGLERISRYIGRPITINQDTSLHLGYADDNYKDNGYYAHDDGTENQCKGTYNAYVKITVWRVPTGPASPAGNCVNTNLKIVSPVNGWDHTCQAPVISPITLKWVLHNPAPNFRTAKVMIKDFNTGQTRVINNVPLGQNGNGQVNLTNISCNSHYAVRVECEQAPGVCSQVDFNLSYVPPFYPLSTAKSCSADDVKYNRHGCGASQSHGASMPMPTHR
jgi:hypothetical protein